MRIGLMGPWGGNLGDAAIQQAMIYHVRKYYPDAALFGFSLDPDDTQRRHGIPAFPIQRPPISNDGTPQKSLLYRLSAYMRNHPSEKIRRLERWVIRGLMELRLLKNAYENTKNLDLFIISGGGQLDDYWGGPFSHPYALLKFVSFARLNKAKVFFVSVGAGPIEHKLSRLFFKRALALANYRSYRDFSSKKLIDSIGFQRDDPVLPDLAFSLPLSNYAEIDHPQNSKLKVGIGPMCWFDPRIWPEKDQAIYIDYLDRLAEFVIWLVNQEYIVSFLPGEVDSDIAAIDDLLSILTKKGYPLGSKGITRKSIQTVDELMNEMVTLDVFVGTRLHSLLLAILVNKPVLAISYHQKIDIMLQDLGIGEYCVPIKTMDVERAKRLFQLMVENAAQIKTQIATGVSDYREKLETQYEKLFGFQ